MHAPCPTIMVSLGTATGSMVTARFNLQLLVLPNCMVQAADGRSSFAQAESSVELQNPSTRNWTTTGSMNVRRFLCQMIPSCGRQMVRLFDGRALVAGGVTMDAGPENTLTELYDPIFKNWTLKGSMQTARSGFQMLICPMLRL